MANSLIREINTEIKPYIADDPSIVFNYLSPKNYDGPHRSWIYRGQRDSNWSLLPALFREDCINKWPEFKGKGKFNYQEFCQGEYNLLRRFVKLADSVGLKIPTDSFSFRTMQNPDFNCFPLVQNMEIWAIAQHHGIPTRLLDFTHNSLYAAYFAAYWCIKEEDYKGDLSVWAINVKEYCDIMKDTNRRIQLASVPTFDNNYLYVQKAVFLYEQGLHEKWKNELHTDGMDFSIEKAMYDELKAKGVDPNKIIKRLVFPKHKAEQLIHSLHLNDIHLAYLKPNYDSIKESMELEDKIGFKRM